MLSSYDRQASSPFWTPFGNVDTELFKAVLSGKDPGAEHD